MNAPHRQPDHQSRKLRTSILYFSALVWLSNGLFCKVLNLVPRHEQIVARILGNDFSRPLTVLIGLAEIVMAGWIVSGIHSRINVIAQIITVATMNLLEYLLVPDLLLWGKLNPMFAAAFILLVSYNEFAWQKQKA